MVLSNQECQAVVQTMATPGWEVICRLAKNRIETVKLAALANDQEEEFLPLYRKVWAAQNAFQEFVNELAVQAELEGAE